MVFKISNILTSCKYFTQEIAVFGAFLLMLQTGIIIGWPSPNLPRLESGNFTITLTKEEVSWLVSFLSLGGFVGGILGAFLMAFIGSRRTVLLTLVLVSVSWIFLIVADSVAMLLTSRILGGITCGMAYACFSIYLGETSKANLRGTLVSVAAAGNPFGIVISTIMETYLSIQVSSSIYLAHSLVGVIIFLWLEDSSYYFVKKNNHKKARKSIDFYLKDCEVEEELIRMKIFLKAYAGQTICDKFQEFKKPATRKSIFLIIVLFILPHISGMLIVMSYMQVILINGNFDLIDPDQFVIYANITSIVASFLTVRLMDLLGRRFLLIISGGGTSIAMISLGLYFYLLSINFTKNIKWLSIFAILMYLIMYSVGFASVPSTVLSEMCPENIKSVAACVAVAATGLFGFIVSKAYQPMVDLMGEAYVFWIHAVLSFLAIPCALLMPETKGKTLQEIQDMLVKNNN